MTIPARSPSAGREHRIYLTELEVTLLREQLLARARGNLTRVPDRRG